LVRSFLARVPRPRLGVDEVVPRVVVLIESDRVEEEELELWTDVDRVRDAALLDVRLRLLGDVARITRVPLAGDRILHVADEDQRRDRGERIHLRGRGVGNEQHVGLVDRLETADRGAIEAEAVFEDVFPQLRDGNRKVLQEAGEIDEAQVDDPGALLLGHLEDVFAGHLRTPSPVKSLRTAKAFGLPERPDYPSQARP